MTLSGRTAVALSALALLTLAGSVTSCGTASSPPEPTASTPPEPAGGPPLASPPPEPGNTQSAPPDKTGRPAGTPGRDADDPK